MELKFRTLTASEIDCRVQKVYESKNEKGLVVPYKISVLLYKDARCDQNLLDESVGATCWTRSHQLIGDRLYCTVSIYDKETNQWISKQDVGTESNTEKEKGQASDAFKRACFNWGIGRELYSAPNINITLCQDDMYFNQTKNKYDIGIKLHVASIAYSDGREIISLTIADAKGRDRFCYNNGKGKSIKVDTQPQPEPIPAPAPTQQPQLSPEQAEQIQVAKENAIFAELAKITDETLIRPFYNQHYYDFRPETVGYLYNACIDKNTELQSQSTNNQQ